MKGKEQEGREGLQGKRGGKDKGRKKVVDNIRNKVIIFFY